MFTSANPAIWECELIGDCVSADVIRLRTERMVFWVGNPVTGVLTGREEDTEERQPREDRGRDRGDVATSQGLLGGARSGRREGSLLPWSMEGAGLQQLPWLQTLAPSTGESTLLLC